MRLIRLVGLIGFLGISAFGQGTAIRSNNGSATNLTTVNGFAVSAAGNNSWIETNAAGSLEFQELGTNWVTISPAGFTGVGTNPVHQLDVAYNTSNLVGNANSAVPAAVVYKVSNGANNTHNVFQVDATLTDIPNFLLGRVGDGIDISWQRNGVVGGDHLLISPEGNTRGIAVFGDGHVEIQNGSPGDLLCQARLGIAGGLNVGSTNVAGMANGQVSAIGPLTVSSGTANFSGIASNKIATVGSYGVPTVFGVTNISNTTGSATLGGIGTSPNLAGHSSVCEMMGTVQISSATTATLTVAFAWTDEAGTAQSTNVVPATTINANTDLSLGPLIITTAANTAVKVSSTLTGTSTYSLHAIATALVNN